VCNYKLVCSTSLTGFIRIFDKTRRTYGIHRQSGKRQIQGKSMIFASCLRRTPTHTYIQNVKERKKRSSSSYLNVVHGAWEFLRVCSICFCKAEKGLLVKRILYMVEFVRWYHTSLTFNMYTKMRRTN